MTEVSNESPSTHEETPENAVWLLYELDAVMGAPLHLLAFHVYMCNSLLWHKVQEHNSAALSLRRKCIPLSGIVRVCAASRERYSISSSASRVPRSSLTSEHSDDRALGFCPKFEDISNIINILNVLNTV